MLLLSASGALEFSKKSKERMDLAIQKAILWLDSRW